MKQKNRKNICVFLHYSYWRFIKILKKLLINSNQQRLENVVVIKRHIY